LAGTFFSFSNYTHKAPQVNRDKFTGQLREERVWKIVESENNTVPYTLKSIVIVYGLSHLSLG
jgi:hypothetical protein